VRTKNAIEITDDPMKLRTQPVRDVGIFSAPRKVTKFPCGLVFLPPVTRSGK